MFISYQYTLDKHSVNPEIKQAGILTINELQKLSAEQAGELKNIADWNGNQYKNVKYQADIDISVNKFIVINTNYSMPDLI